VFTKLAKFGDINYMRNKLATYAFLISSHVAEFETPRTV